MPHTKRPPVSRHRPHHVTIRVNHATWNLRSQRCFRPIREAFTGVHERAGFRVVHYSVQHNHLHLIVEADSRPRMTRGMRALVARIARGLNRVMGARGKRLDDRFHEHVLKTPNETRNALRYVLGNRDVHLRRWGREGAAASDPFSSAEPDAALVHRPASWLLSRGWLQVGPP